MRKYSQRLHPLSVQSLTTSCLVPENSVCSVGTNESYSWAIVASCNWCCCVAWRRWSMTLMLSVILPSNEEIRCQIYFYQVRLHSQTTRHGYKNRCLIVCLLVFTRMKSLYYNPGCLKWSLSGLIDGHSVCLGHCRFSEIKDIQKQNNTLDRHHPQQ